MQEQIQYIQEYLRDLDKQVRALQRLDVNPPASFALTYSGTPVASHIAYFSGQGTISHGSINYGASGGTPILSATTSAGMLLRDDGGNNAIYVSDGGNVGIGFAAAPDYDLEIRKNTADFGAIGKGAATTDYARFFAQGLGNQFVQLVTFGTAYTGTGFGVTLGGYSIVNHVGAAGNGMIIGNSANKPIIIGINNAEVARWVSTGLQIASGKTLTVETMGGTVTFTGPPVISSFASAIHNHTNAAGGGQLTTAALSDIASGTWTPAVSGSGSNPTVTYTTQTGSYLKIGTMVICSATIVINTISGGSGNARFSLPFTSNASSHMLAAYTSGVDLPGTPVSLVASNNTSADYVHLYAIQDNAASQLVQISGLAAGDVIIFSGIYFT